MPQAKQFPMVRVSAQTVDRLRRIIHRELPGLNGQEVPISFYVNHALKYVIMQKENEKK